jgi:hypothetical protein
MQSCAENPKIPNGRTMIWSGNQKNPTKIQKNPSAKIQKRQVQQIQKRQR